MPHQLNTFLNANEAMGQLSRRARLVGILQQHYQQIAPPSLLGASRVIQLRSSTLIIAADNGTVASKLRQLCPEMISLFLTRGCEITGIQIRVQVRNQTVGIQHKPRMLGKKGQQAIEDLAVNLPDSPLKASLRRLAKRAT